MSEHQTAGRTPGGPDAVPDQSAGHPASGHPVPEQPVPEQPASEHPLSVPRQVVVPASDSLQQTLRTFGDAAGFPDYYGANLDALLDCLRDEPDLQVTLTDAERLRASDPEGYRGLVGVLRQARSELGDFHFSISR